MATSGSGEAGGLIGEPGHRERIGSIVLVDTFSALQLVNRGFHIE